MNDFSSPEAVKRRRCRPFAFLTAVCLFFTSSIVVSPLELFAAPVVEAPVATPAGLSAQGTTELTVTLRIVRAATDPTVIGQALYLYRVDANGKNIQTYGRMYDDATNGDAVAGDDVYSLRISVSRPPSEGIRIQASVPFMRVLRRAVSPITHVPVVTSNLPPVFTSQPVEEAIQSKIYYYQAAAQDPEGGAVAFALDQAPEGCTLFPGGLVRWVPKQFQIGQQPVTLKATDPFGASAAQTFMVSVAGFNEAPVFTSMPPRQVKAGEVYEYDAKAFDPEGTVLNFSLLESPQGMTVDALTGAVRWSPGQPLIGESPHVVLQVADAGGQTAVQDYLIDVTGPPLELIRPTNFYDVNSGETLELDLEANYENAAFRVTPMPQNASINPQTKKFTFTPSEEQIGIHNMVFEAIFGGMRDVNPVLITVRKVNHPPVLESVSPQRVKEGETLRISVIASDPDNDDLSFSLPDPILANLFFDQVKKQIVFMPDFDQAGEHAVVLRVSDGKLTADVTIPITVADVTEPTVSALDLVVDKLPNPSFRTTLPITGSVIGEERPVAYLPPVLVTGVSPARIAPGRRITIEITGLNTQFVQDTTTLSLGQGITVESFEVLSPVTARAILLASTDAAIGPRSLVVKQDLEIIDSVVGFEVVESGSEVKGVLMDEFTLQPLQGARVVANGTPVLGVSEANGSFKLEGLVPGNHTIVITRPDYEVLKMDVNLDKNQPLDLGTLSLKALARQFTPGGSLPRSATVASVLDRGLGDPNLSLTLDQAKALVLDMVLALPGQEYGAFDESGNQLNPNMVGGGSFSLTPAGVEQHALALMEGDTYTLEEVLNTLIGAFGWIFGDQMSARQLLGVLQDSVNEAWQNPADPYNALPLMVFNEGTTLQTQAPVLSMSTRLNHLQCFLLASSFMVYFGPILDLAFERLYQRHGVAEPTITVDPLTGERIVNIQGQTIRSSQPGFPTGNLGQAITVASTHFSDALLGGVVYAKEADPNEASNKEGKSASGSFWGNAAASEAGDIFKATVFAAAFVILGKFIFGIATAGFAAGSLGAAGPILAAIAISVVIGEILQLIVHMAASYFAPEAVESLRPPPPVGISNGRDKTGKKVFIRFEKDPHHIEKDAGGTSKLWTPVATMIDLYGAGVNLQLVEFEYQLWRFPSANLTSPRDPGVQLISTHAMPASNGEKDKMEFVLPIERLTDADTNFDAKNIFKIRTVMFYRGYLVTPAEEFETKITLEDVGIELPATIPSEWKVQFSITNASGAINESINNLKAEVDTAQKKFDQAIVQRDATVKDAEKKTVSIKGRQRVAQDFVDKTTLEVQTARNALTVEEKLAGQRYATVQSLARQHLDGIQQGSGGSVADLFDESKVIGRDLAVEAGGRDKLAALKPKLEAYANNYSQTAELENSLKLQNQNARVISAQKSSLQQSLKGNKGMRVVPIEYEIVDPAGFPGGDPVPQKVKKSFLVSGSGSVADAETGLNTTLDAEIAKIEAEEIRQKARLQHVESQHSQSTEAVNASENALRDDFLNTDRMKQVGENIKTAEARLEESTKARDAEKLNLEKAELVEAERIRNAKKAGGIAEAEFQKIEPTRNMKLKADKNILLRMSNSKVVRVLSTNQGQTAVAAVTSIGDTAWGIRDRIKVLPSPFSAPYILIRHGNRVEIFSPAAPPTYPPQDPIYGPGQQPPGLARVASILGEKLSEWNFFSSPQAFAQSVPFVIPSYFETDPDENFTLAFLAPFRDPDNAKGGFLVREYPFTAHSFDAVATGFPSDQIAVDSTGAVYLINNNSLDKFGGRLFRYKGDPVVREHIGQINYYSQMLGVSRGAAPVAMEIGEFKEGTSVVEDLFIANKEDGIFLMSGGAPPPNRVLRVPTHLADTNPAFANGHNRDRIVGQVYAQHEEFKFSGPSDMERDARPRQNETDPPRPVYLSDETNLFALVQLPGSDQAEVIKVVSIPGRRWSGIASDANGNLIFADYNSGDVYLLAAKDLDDIVEGNNAMITANGELDNRAFLLKIGIDRPGDVEMDSQHERYVISTPGGYEAFDLVFIGRYSTNTIEIHSDVLGQQAPVTLRPTRGRVFIVGVPTEGSRPRRARMRIKRRDSATNQTSWTEESIQLEPYGATLAANPL